MASLAFLTDIIKSKFGHIRHFECEVGHIGFAIYLIV